MQIIPGYRHDGFVMSVSVLVRCRIRTNESMGSSTRRIEAGETCEPMTSIRPLDVISTSTARSGRQQGLSRSTRQPADSSCSLAP